MPDQLIGREGEFSAVLDFLDRPIEAHRALVIEGPPGIGKSTIWMAAVQAARARSMVVLTSRPTENEQALPNLVLGDLFGRVEPDVIAALPGARRRAFEAALLIGDPVDGPTDPRALGVAITTMLGLVSAGRPVLIGIDDDQWLDASSAATLAFAIRRMTDLPILLMVTRRLGGRPVVRLEAVIHASAVERVRVGPLSAGGIQQLLHERLGMAMARPMLRQLHEISRGNPFHALELARAWSLDPARDIMLPPAISALDGLVSARIDHLDDRTKRSLLLVAANGRLPVGLLPPLSVTAGDLEPAIAAGLVESSGDSISFTHPLLASAVYEGARGEARREAHRRLAEAMDDAVPRARHLALGAAEPSDELATVTESASNVARGRGLPVAAAELAEHALRLTPAGATAERHRRALMLARAHLAAGGGERARAIISDLLASAPAGPRRAEILALGSELEAAANAVGLLRDALREAAPAPALRAEIHARLANEGRMTRGSTWAAQHVEASLRLSEWLDDDGLRARAISALAILRFEVTDPGALGLAELAHRLAVSASAPELLKETGGTLGHILVWSGMTERARAWLEHQLEEWSDRDEVLRSERLWYLALLELWTGNWAAAHERATESREIRVQYGVEVPPDFLLTAMVALHRGQFDVARSESETALRLASGMYLPAHLAVLATIELWMGNPAGAVAEFTRADAAADARGLVEPALRAWRADYAEALLQVGRTDDAARLLAAWESAAVRVGRERVLAQALRVRGMVAAARGDLETAQGLLEEAAVRLGAVTDPFGRARALLTLGVVRLRLRRKRAARAALDAAVAAFGALGAVSWEQSARGERARIGGRERIEGLSPSERRVAELVAEGRSNREVAAELFLAERTVASHLTRAYAKLGVATRTELARRLRDDKGKVQTS